MVFKFFDKKSKGTGIKNEVKENGELEKELHKTIIRKFKKGESTHRIKAMFGIVI